MTDYITHGLLGFSALTLLAAESTDLALNFATFEKLGVIGVLTFGIILLIKHIQTIYDKNSKLEAGQSVIQADLKSLINIVSQSVLAHSEMSYSVKTLCDRQVRDDEESARLLREMTIGISAISALLQKIHPEIEVKHYGVENTDTEKTVKGSKKK